MAHPAACECIAYHTHSHAHHEKHAVRYHETYDQSCMLQHVYIGAGKHHHVCFWGLLQQLYLDCNSERRAPINRKLCFVDQPKSALAEEPEAIQLGLIQRGIHLQVNVRMLERQLLLHVCGADKKCIVMSPTVML